MRTAARLALVVNDAGDTSEIYERLLSDAGLWVTSCPEREAIDYARDVLPDVILSDIDVRPNAAGRVIRQRFTRRSEPVRGADPPRRGLPARRGDGPAGAHRPRQARRADTFVVEAEAEVSSAASAP